MVSLFSNPEFKTTVKKLGFIFILGFIILCMLCLICLNQINNKVITQNQAIIGSILQKHPELEEDIMASLNSDTISHFEINGSEVLKKYGYFDGMKYFDQPVLKGEFEKMSFVAGIYFILLVGAVFLMLYAENKKMYQKIQKAAISSENVAEGKIEYLSEQGEGDFAKLGHSFNRMAERIKNGMERETKEKELLRNAISDISHQIRTPLASIMMFNDLMLENKDMDHDTREDFLNKNHIQLVRIQWLVESLLKMAMLESQTIQFIKKNIYAIDLLESSVSALAVLAKERQIAIELDAQENMAIYCDERWTVEACINIIKNALEHTLPGGEVKVYCQASALFTKIIIQDNGEGIENKDMPHIFDRFYRGGKTPDAKSVGVGLSLAKLIVEGQQGLIQVKSEPNQGTEFEIMFLTAKNQKI